MAASFEVAGQRVDLGSHRLHPATDPSIMSLIRSLLGDDLQTRERNGRIRLQNKWIGFPLRTGDMVKNLPLRFSAAVAFDTLVKPLRSKVLPTLRPKFNVALDQRSHENSTALTQPSCTALHQTPSLLSCQTGVSRREVPRK